MAEHRFFGPLPARGPWSAVGLTRAQFVAILGLAVAVFVVAGGPLWSHLHDGHLVRIVASYGLIPPLVGAALWRNGTARGRLLVEASAVIALVKLVLTAVLLIALAIGH